MYFWLKNEISGRYGGWGRRFGRFREAGAGLEGAPVQGVGRLLCDLTEFAAQTHGKLPV